MHTILHTSTVSILLTRYGAAAKVHAANPAPYRETHSLTLLIALLAVRLVTIIKSNVINTQSKTD